jgi:hypothetical protein
MGSEAVFFEAATVALKLIQQALAGDTKAFKALEPLLPAKLKTSITRAAAEARARQKLGR